jgi:hypothetical protein
MGQKTGRPRTRYGYEMALVDVKGNWRERQVRFEREEGHEARAAFVLTRGDLELALGMVLEEAVRTGGEKPLCCFDGEVLFGKLEKKED